MNDSSTKEPRHSLTQGQDGGKALAILNLARPADILVQGQAVVIIIQDGGTDHLSKLLMLEFGQSLEGFWLLLGIVAGLVGGGDRVQAPFFQSIGTS